MGSQIIKKSEGYILAPHTELKARAAGIAWKFGLTRRFIICGGHNFFVRYNYQRMLESPDFTFEVLAKAQEEKSEAEIIAEFLQREYYVPREAILLECNSLTTRENLEFLNIILKRSTFKEFKEIGIIILMPQKEKVERISKEIGLRLKPIFAEDLLAKEEGGIEKICKYYLNQKGEKWQIGEIVKYLKEGKSIKEIARNSSL